MWTVPSRRAIARAVVCLAATFAAPLASQAEARDASLVIAAIPSVGRAPAVEAGAVPRFFTIAAVLAKREAQMNPEHAIEREQLRGTIAAVSTASIESRSMGPFEDRGYILFGSDRGSIASKWADIQERWTIEQRQLDDCLSKRSTCTDAMRLYHQIARQASHLNDEERIAYINARVNQAVRYQGDTVGHGVSDMWTSPLMTLAGAGDCEDYAIAKFYLLQASGVSVDRMRIVLVRDNRAGEDHAVLTVKTEAGWSVLDNRWNEIHVSRDLEHYTPVAALGADVVQIYAVSFASSPEVAAYSAPSSGW